MNCKAKHTYQRERERPGSGELQRVGTCANIWDWTSKWDWG